VTALRAHEDAEPRPAGPTPGIPTGGAEIDNSNRYREVRIRQLRPWLDRLIEELTADSSAGLGVRFVSDREMARLNRRFRGVDGTTDVLSFSGGESAEGLHLGDIAISIPAARRQARERGHSVEREVETLLLHGLLHCLGHDHETDSGEMVRLERRLRRRWVRSLD